MVSAQCAHFWWASHAALCGCQQLQICSWQTVPRNCLPCTSLCTSHPQGIQAHWMAGPTAAAAANHVWHRLWPLQAVVVPERQTLLIMLSPLRLTGTTAAAAKNLCGPGLGCCTWCQALFEAWPESSAWLQLRLRSSGAGHGASRLPWCMGGRLTGSGCEPSLQTLTSRCWSAQAGAM